MARSKAPNIKPRGAIRLLFDRSFGFFFYARLFTSMGIWLYAVVASIAAYELTGSATAVALVSLGQFLPQLVLAPLAGSRADKGNIKRQMILGRLLCAMGSGGLGIAFIVASHANSWTLALLLYCGSLIVGLGLVIGGPAMQSSVALLVTKDELPTALALNTAPLSVGRILGPAVGAVTVLGFGYPVSFIIAGALHASFIFLIMWIKFPARQERKSTTDYRIRGALSFVRGNKPVLLSLIGITAVGFGAEPTVTLAPALAAHLDDGAETVGLLATFLGIGAGVGVVASSIFAKRISHEHKAMAALATMTLSVGICTIPLPLAPLLLAFTLNGFGFIVAVSSLSTIMQLRLPHAMFGRVMALWLMGFAGARPIGALLVGFISDLTTVQVAFGFVCLVMLLCTILCRASQLRSPEAPPAPLADPLHVKEHEQTHWN
jgi:MFS family permease